MKKNLNFNDFKILCINNEKNFNIFKIIENNPKYNVDFVEDFSKRLIKLEEDDISIVLINMDIEKKDKNFFDKLIKINKNINIIIINSLANNVDNFILTMKYDIFRYILKPINVNMFKNVLYEVFNSINEKRVNEKNKKLLKHYQEITEVFSNVSKTDSEGYITYVNKKFCETTGYSEEELIGKKHNILNHPDNDRTIYKEMWETIKNKKEIWSGVIKNLNKKGETFYFQMSIKPYLNEKKEIEGYVCLREDVSLIVTPKQQLLDYIKNFNDCLLVLMKIDNYDTMEKFYGEDDISEVCKSYKTEIYCESKLTNYNFEKCFYLENGWYRLVAKNVKIPDVVKLNEEMLKFQDNLKNIPFFYKGIEFDFTLTMSYSFGSKDLYQSSRFGLKHRLYNKIPIIMSNDYAKLEQEKAQKNIETIDIVKTAINNHKIISYFQPIINNETKEIEKYESLVRLINEKGEVVSPFFFLDIAKKGNYYSKITNMVLENSFTALKNTNIVISINLSVLDIEKEETRKKLYELLDKYNDYCKRIIFELLEDEDAKDFRLIKSFIKNVKAKGVKIAIDDFGSGYSNFERLLEYEPDILKIDGSLIKNIETNKYSLSIVETIVTFAKKSNIKTVAEFVENENIFNILTKIGIDYSQGYYFGKPECIEKIIESKQLTTVF